MPWPWLNAVWLVSLVLGVSGCFAFRESQGGGQTAFEPPRQVNPADVVMPPGYRIEAVATGLTFPTGVAFDDEGGVYAVEAGYSYGEAWTVPRIVKLEPGGGRSVVIEGRDGNGPWTGATFHNGALFIAEGGQRYGGRILRRDPDGQVTRLVEGLPSLGDHHTNGVVAGPDGWLYFGQGTATNSGVVGPDNADFGWLSRYPEFHDTPCRDITLAGRNYVSANPLNPGGGTVVTGAFSPFGTATRPGQVIPGGLPCNGAIFRVRPDGGELELVAWGLRNPYGLAFSPDGTLYVTENSYDVRGSRPVFGPGDPLWRVEPGAWYGWPDFHGATSRAHDERYAPPGQESPTLVLAEHPGTPPEPAAMFPVHSSSNGMDFSRNPQFGHVGQAFVAQFGDMAPAVGKVLAPVGFRVVRVDVESGIIVDFAVNREPGGGPASRTGGGGLERPVSVRFDPAGTTLYVVDFGVMTMSEQGPRPMPETGVLWRITPTAERPQG